MQLKIAKTNKETSMFNPLKSFKKIHNLLLLDKTELHSLPEQIYLRRLLPHLAIDCVFDVGANNGNMPRCLEKNWLQRQNYFL